MITAALILLFFWLALYGWIGLRCELTLEETYVCAFDLTFGIIGLACIAVYSI